MMTRKQGIAGLLALVAVAVWANTTQPDTPPAVIAPRLPLDLARPDALIVSQSLTQLPRDLLAVPLLKQTLTEDFVFYYDTHEDRLGLIGTLKRIAFEHNETLADQLLGELLDQPAEVALWRGQGGKLDHYLLSLQRGGLAKLMEIAARVAADDAQLRVSGELTLEGGQSMPVYGLRYGSGRQLYFTARAERLLVATDVQLLLGGANEEAAEQQTRSRVLGGLLSGNAVSDPFLNAFRLKPSGARQSLTVTASYLTFGYGDLFQGVDALRVDFGNGQWSTWGRFSRARWDGAQARATPLWAVAPTGAALCGSAPMNWPVLTEALAGISRKPEQSRSFVAGLNAPATVCWYGNSSYYTPLVLVGLNGAEATTSQQDAYLATLFQGAVAKNTQITRTKTADATVRLWQGRIESRYAIESDQSGTPRFLTSLARVGHVLAFSPDHALVEKTLSVAAKRYPALADTLPAQPVALYANPRDLAKLLKADVMDSLPQDSEPVFFEAASTRLLPRFDALAKFPPFVLAYPERPDGEGGWAPLQWQTLR